MSYDRLEDKLYALTRENIQLKQEIQALHSEISRVRSERDMHENARSWNQG